MMKTPIETADAINDLLEGRKAPLPSPEEIRAMEEAIAKFEPEIYRVEVKCLLRKDQQKDEEP